MKKILLLLFLVWSCSIHAQVDSNMVFHPKIKYGLSSSANITVVNSLSIGPLLQVGKHELHVGLCPFLNFTYIGEQALTYKYTGEHVINLGLKIDYKYIFNPYSRFAKFFLFYDVELLSHKENCEFADNIYSGTEKCNKKVFVNNLGIGTSIKASNKFFIDSQLGMGTYFYSSNSNYEFLLNKSPTINISNNGRGLFSLFICLGLSYVF